MSVLDLLIEGEKVQASSGQTFTQNNPLTGGVATEAAAATVDDANRAADAAARAFPEWSQTGPTERRRLLLAAADNLEARGSDIARAMADELGATAAWAGFNVMLDAGADIRADEEDLLTYALMGASYARNGLGLDRPRVGLLNVGVEEHKGRAELKVAHDIITRAAPRGEFDYVGFVEGGDLPADRVDVVVTDGFTGNVALKTGEGTANFISDSLRAAFKTTWFSRVAALLAMTSLRRLKKTIDPRRVNGGVFLGLNGTVIKSHGSADATGVAAAVALAAQLGRSGFSDKLAARVASAAVLAQDELQDDDTTPAAKDTTVK